MSETIEKSAWHDFTRGGQTFLHKIRMVSQVVMRLCLLMCVIFLFSSGLFFRLESSANLRHSLVKIGQAWIYDHVAPQHKIKLKNGRTVESHWLLHNHATKILLEHGKQLANESMLIGLFWALLMGAVSVNWLMLRGRSQTATKLLKGTQLIEPRQLKKRLIKWKVASDLTIGSVPLPKGSETTHFLIHGTVGTGKSVCMKSLMDQIRERGNRAIIYDKHGDYVKHFFREGKDILLNPLDARCAQWDLWAECPHAANYDSLAAGLIPATNGSADPFWVNAARTIFSATAYKLSEDPTRDIDKLLGYLLRSDLDKITTLLKGTAAETLVSDKIAKTALSIKTVLSTYLNTLKFLPKLEDNPFSIRDWVNNEGSDSWLFITSRADMHETLKPLISAWLDLAANALMSLPDSKERRIWMLLDELPSLQRLPYLSQTFAESRKFGGCLVAAIQNFSQLRKLYGNDGAEEISDLCNTRLYFRSPSSETARWASRELGQNEVLEHNEGLSYGANTHRDGVSLSKQRQLRPIVSDHDIATLENLHAYMKLPPVADLKGKGHAPIAKVKFEITNRVEMAPNFVQASPTVAEEGSGSEGSSGSQVTEEEGKGDEKIPIPQCDETLESQETNDFVHDLLE